MLFSLTSDQRSIAKGDQSPLVEFKVDGKSLQIISNQTQRRQTCLQ